MSVPRMRIAHLDDERLARLQALENEIGAVVVALEPQFIPASLTPDQVRRLQAAEKELGVVLLAYQAT